MANENTFIDLQRMSELLKLVKEASNSSTESFKKFLDMFEDEKEKGFGAFNDLLKKSIDNYDTLKQMIDEYGKAFKRLTPELREYVKNIKDLDENSIKASSGFQKLSDEMKKAFSLSDDDEVVKEIIKIREQSDEAEKAIKIFSESLEDLGDMSLSASKAMDKMANSVGLLNKMSDTRKGFFWKMSDLVRSGDTVKLATFFNVSLVSLKDWIHPLNISSNLMNHLIKNLKTLVIGFDEANSSVNRTFGSIDRYTTVISNARDAGAEFGLTTKDNAEAIQQAATYFHSFNRLSQYNQTIMTTMIGTYTKFGVATSLVVSAMGKLTDTFRDSGQISRMYMREIMTLSDALGKSLNDTVSELNNNMGRLARFGAKEMLTVFKDLQIYSRGLSLEMATVLQITEQFDSYNDAASAVGKFNAIFGGPYLNAIQLMRVTDSERLKIIKDQIDAMGIQYTALNAQEKQVLATTVGIKDMAEAEKFFTRSIYEYNDAKRKQAIEEDKAKQRAVEVQTAQEKLSNAFLALIKILEPFLWIFRQVATVVADFIGLADGWVGRIIAFTSTIYLLIRSFTILKSVMSFFGKINTLFTAATNAAAAASKKFTIISKGKNTALVQNLKLTQAATINNTALGNSTAVAGGKLATAAKGVSTFGKALGGATKGMVLAGVGLAAMGVGLTVFGAGLMVVGEGLASIYDAFSSDQREHKRMMELASISNDSHKNWDMIANAVERLSKAIESSDIDKLEAFTEMAENDNLVRFRVVNDLFNNINNTTSSNSDSLTKTKEIVEQIVNLSSRNDTSNLRAAKDLITTIKTEKATTNQSSENNRPIILQLDDLVLAKWHEKTHDRNIKTGLPVNVYNK